MQIKGTNGLGGAGGRSGLPDILPDPVRAKKVADHKTDTEQLQISKLKARDTQVRQHEQAHLSAAAGLNVSNATFTYQRGPNGINYRVGGEVRIDTSPARTPEETLAKAEQIIDVALAPSDPSAIDRAVAARARQMALEARTELARQSGEKTVEAAISKHPGAAEAYEDEKPATHSVNTYA